MIWQCYQVNYDNQVISNNWTIINVQCGKCYGRYAKCAVATIGGAYMLGIGFRGQLELQPTRKGTVYEEQVNLQRTRAI